MKYINIEELDNAIRIEEALEEKRRHKMLCEQNPDKVRLRSLQLSLIRQSKKIVNEALLSVNGG